MLSQTLRFGVFIVVIMAGFALAFNAVFGSCDAGSLLDESYGSFGTAFLTVFKAPLGEFEFEAFDDVGSDCPDIPSPGRASDAGTFLLVVSGWVARLQGCINYHPVGLSGVSVYLFLCEPRLLSGSYRLGGEAGKSLARVSRRWVAIAQTPQLVL